MKVAVLGLGYVGAVTAACLAEEGHDVIGVDPSSIKTDAINRGTSPVVEADLPGLIADAVAAGRLRATDAALEGVRHSDLAFICVGTPSGGNGALDLAFLERAVAEVGEALRHRTDPYVVVIRSTVLPGTTRERVVPILEARSGKRAGIDFGVCVNPEFLREATAVRDFQEPPKVVIGTDHPWAGDLLEPLVAKPGAPLVVVPPPVAEMVKYVDNAWHATKVAFANEIGRISKASGVSGQEVMDVFRLDTKLNLSERYLRPGMAFGGSCLPKDVRALAHHARSLDQDVPLLGSLLPSNRVQIDVATSMVLQKPSRRVAVLGLSFKAGTDDLRESPLVTVVERLIGKGYDVRVFDEDITMSQLIGANQRFVLERLPHIAELLVPTLDEALEHGDTIVLGNRNRSFVEVLGRLRPDQELVDLVHVVDGAGDARYEGIGW